MNVSDFIEADRYFQKILGFKAIENEQGLFDYKMGKTIIGINVLDDNRKKYVGMPNEILGMSLIQFVVKFLPGFFSNHLQQINIFFLFLSFLGLNLKS